MALYQNGLPIVPATTWLRYLEEERDLALNTRLAYANALLPFFRWLATQKRLGSPLSFWDMTLQRIKAYKRALLSAGAPVSRSTARPEGQGLQPTSVKKYMQALSYLISWWLAPADREKLFERQGEREKRVAARGALTHLRVTAKILNDAFTVSLRGRRRRRRKYGLTVSQARAVFEWLEARNPLKPKAMTASARTPTERRRKAKAQANYKVRQMLWYRNKALWGFLLITGARVGEVCRVREHDVDEEAGEVNLVDDPGTRHLGDLKTGEGKMWYSRNHACAMYVDTWLMFGRPTAIARYKQRTGKKDHGMLFCKQNGDPIRKSTVKRLFRKIYESMDLKAQGVKLSPHMARHTGSTILRRSGADPEAIQAWLRHQSLATQEDYSQLELAEIRRQLAAAQASGFRKITPTHA